MDGWGSLFNSVIEQMVWVFFYSGFPPPIWSLLKKKKKAKYAEGVSNAKYLLVTSIKPYLNGLFCMYSVIHDLYTFYATFGNSQLWTHTVSLERIQTPGHGAMVIVHRRQINYMLNIYFALIGKREWTLPKHFGNYWGLLIQMNVRHEKCLVKGLAINHVPSI